MNNEEISRYIHVEIMGKCWHDMRPIDDDAVEFECIKCPANYSPLFMDDGNPDYCSDDSPRRLLNEVVAMVIGFERSNQSKLAWRTVSKSDAFHEALKGVIGYESDLDAPWLTITAAAEQIARACVEAHKLTAKPAA